MLNKINKMSGIIITKEGKTREIDLTLVEEIENNLERILRKRESFTDRSHIQYSIEILDGMEKLNREQLIYLANNFLGLLLKYADLYQSALDNPKEFCERIFGYKKLIEKAKNIINI